MLIKQSEFSIPGYQLHEGDRLPGIVYFCAGSKILVVGSDAGSYIFYLYHKDATFIGEARLDKSRGRLDGVKILAERILLEFITPAGGYGELYSLTELDSQMKTVDICTVPRLYFGHNKNFCSLYMSGNDLFINVLKYNFVEKYALSIKNGSWHMEKTNLSAQVPGEYFSIYLCGKFTIFSYNSQIEVFDELMRKSATLRWNPGNPDWAETTLKTWAFCESEKTIALSFECRGKQANSIAVIRLDNPLSPFFNHFIAVGGYQVQSLALPRKRMVMLNGYNSKEESGEGFLVFETESGELLYSCIQPARPSSLMAKKIFTYSNGHLTAVCEYGELSLYDNDFKLIHKIETTGEADAALDESRTQTAVFLFKTGIRPETVSEALVQIYALSPRYTNTRVVEISDYI